MSEAKNRFESSTEGQAPEVLAYEEFCRASNEGGAALSSSVPEVDRRNFLRGALAAAGVASFSPLASTVMSSPAEAAEKTREVYTAARRLVASTRIHNGLHMINTFHNGSIIPIGQLNTGSYAYTIVGADRIDDVLRELNFTDAVAFAERYNIDFPHRSDADRARLVDDAKYVAQMRASGRPIERGNAQFVNLRLAIMIWLASEHVTRDYSRGFMLGGKPFNTPEVLKVLPGLSRNNGLARLLLDHELTPHLELMLELARRNFRVPDITRPSIPAIAQFIRSVSTLTASGRVREGILRQMSTIYHTMSADEGGYGTGSGLLFMYDQFIASPIGKRYKEFLDFLGGIRLARNNWSGDEVTNSEFAHALEQLPESDQNYTTINRFLPYWGN